MSPGGGKAKLKGKHLIQKRDPRHPIKKPVEPDKEKQTGEPGGGPQAKEDHCRENRKFLANRFEGPGIQHPLGGSGTLTGNPDLQPHSACLGCGQEQRKCSVEDKTKSKPTFQGGE